MITTFLISMPAGMEWLLLVLVAVGFIFWIFTLVDVLKSKFSDDITKIIWALVVFFLGIIGAAIYWIFGRSTKITIEN